MRLKYYSNCGPTGDNEPLTVFANSFTPQIIPKNLHMPDPVLYVRDQALNRTDSLPHNGSSKHDCCKSMCSSQESCQMGTPRTLFRGKVIFKRN